MTCSVFVKFVSDPETDPTKAIVGLACAAQAVSDGHDVDVFFAATSTRMLVPGYLEGSFNSLKATAGIEEGQGGIIVPDEAMTWSGPPGVIALATAAETVLCY